MAFACGQGFLTARQPQGIRTSYTVAQGSKANMATKWKMTVKRQLYKPSSIFEDISTILF